MTDKIDFIVTSEMTKIKTIVLSEFVNYEFINWTVSKLGDVSRIISILGHVCMDLTSF